jgi:hypothetical protein
MARYMLSKTLNLINNAMEVAYAGTLLHQIWTSVSCFFSGCYLYDHSFLHGNKDNFSKKTNPEQK